MIDKDEIRELAALMEETGLTALEIDRKNDTMRLERATLASSVAVAGPVAVAAAEKPGVAPAGEAATGNAITAPMVGVFYASPSPGAKPYVSVGDRVTKGQVVCLVEAMKLMNEILAETDGTVSRICVDNGQVVEFGEPLMYLS